MTPDESALMAEFDAKLAEFMDYLRQLEKKAESGGFMDGMHYMAAYVLAAEVLGVVPPGWTKVGDSYFPP